MIPPDQGAATLNKRRAAPSAKLKNKKEMETTEQIKGPTETEILAGGVEKILTLRDGTKATLQILLLPVLKMGLLGDNMRDEAAQAMLYVGKDQKFVESLSDDAIETVLTEGQRLNFPRLGRWLKRRGEMITLSDPDPKLIEQIAKAAVQMGLK